MVYKAYLNQFDVAHKSGLAACHGGLTCQLGANKLSGAKPGSSADTVMLLETLDSSELQAERLVGQEETLPLPRISLSTADKDV